MGPNSAELQAWDMIDGYKRVFAVFEVKRDAQIIEVRAIDDPVGLFAESTRIGRDPDELLGEQVPRLAVCPGKRANAITELIQRAQEMKSP